MDTLPVSLSAILRDWRVQVFHCYCASRTHCVSSTFSGVVLSVDEAINAIRNRMGLRMAEFGRLIGTHHGTVSRYESGQSDNKTKSTLILLLLLAQNDDEKAPILKALGIIDDAEFQAVYQDAEDKLREYAHLETRSRKIVKKAAGRRDFVMEAAAIAESRMSLDPSVAKILHRLRTPETSRQVQVHLRNLDTALTEPKKIKLPKQRKKRSAKTDLH
jgi:transcriptional regulator with XRE-family HTH domain